MTPVREALEEIIGLLDKMAALHPSRDLREVLPDPKGLADRARLLLAAAPGEPCAWVKRLADNWRGRRDSLTGDSVRDSCADELEKVAARHTTPQPAAGWNEAINAAMATIEKMRVAGACNFSDARHQGQRGADYLDTLYDACQAVKALRREAPAPAEGVKQQSDEVFDIEETRRENADNVRTLDAIAEFVGCPHDEELTVNHVRAHYATRPDTAEARLREALQYIADNDIPYLKTPTPGAKGYPGHYGYIAKKALSAGGDEAKESEGRFQGSLPSGESDPTVTLGCRPSEPSPPDDRREIIARIIHGDDDDWEDLKQAAQSHGPRLKFKNQIAEVYAKADAILTALDENYKNPNKA